MNAAAEQIREVVLTDMHDEPRAWVCWGPESGASIALADQDGMFAVTLDVEPDGAVKVRHAPEGSSPVSHLPFASFPGLLDALAAADASGRFVLPLTLRLSDGSDLTVGDGVLRQRTAAGGEYRLTADWPQSCGARLPSGESESWYLFPRMSGRRDSFADMLERGVL